MSLVALQTKVVARLEAVSATDFFHRSVPLPTTANGQPIAVISEIKGDIAYQLQRSLESMGIAIIVLTPLGQLIDPNNPRLDMLSPLKIQIQEDVTLNREATVGTQVPALDLVRFVLRRLHAWPHMLYESSASSPLDPAYAGAAKAQMIRSQKQAFTLLTDTPLVYDVDFLAPLNLSVDPAA